MTIQVAEILKLTDLKVGDRIQTSYDQFGGLSKERWGNPGAEAVVVGQYVPYNNCIYVLLDEENRAGGAKLLREFTIQGQDHITINYPDYSKVPTNEYRWSAFSYVQAMRKIISPINNFKSVASELGLSPECAPGLHVCRCGFMNKDISVSAIMNGKYCCYQCRVVWKK